jgi:hypothetical protein
METKAAYKGTDQNCQCRGYQYEVGQEYEHKGSIDVCSWGFHACENPLDTFSYYPPDGKNRFFEVEQSGETKTKEDKTVSQRIKIKAEMTLEQFFAIGFKLIFDKVKKTVTESELTANTSGDYAHANTSGYGAHANTSGYEAHANTSGYHAHANTSGNRAHANTSGDYAHANTSGDYAHANTSGYKAHANTSGYGAHANTSGYHAHANTSGDYAHANTSGDYAHANTSGYGAHANTSGDYAHANTSGYGAHANTSGNRAHANTSGNHAHANTSGDEAIACSLGVRARARAVKGWIILVDWRRDGDKWTIRSIHHAKVGQKIGRKVIKSNEQYWFEDGKLKYEVCNG